MLILRLLDFANSIGLNHEHLSLAELLQVLQVGMSEANYILKELQRMLDWVERLESKEADSNYIVAEDIGTQDVGVLAVFLGGFVRSGAARHELDNMQNVIEELHGGMELLVRDFVDLGLCITLLNAATVKRTMQEIEGAKHERYANVTNVDLEVHLGHLGLGLVARQHFVLFLHGVIGLLLRLLVLCFGPDTDGL